jgi:nucleoside phosphorylase
MKKLLHGDSVIQNSVIIEAMIKKILRQADGIDMEAYGMYYAAQQAIKPKPIPICMKAISDYANKDKSNEHQEYAAFISAQFAKFFITEKLFQYS